MYKATAAEVSKLRNTTGAGMMDSKKALEEAQGDFEQAVEILRKKGQKVASKRSDRDSSEGVTLAQLNQDATKAVLISLNCETDFVAKNEDFIQLAKQLANKALAFNSKEEFLKADFNGISIEDKLTEQTGVIGEKVEIGNFENIEGDFLAAYIHANNKIASVVALSKKVDRVEEAGKDIAMQVAAMDPAGLDEGDVAQEIIDKELEIAKDTLRQEGKPENMIDQIAQGKLKKFFKECTLVHQAFIKDNKLSVQDYLKSYDNDLKVVGFKRIAL